eukprot:3586775-Rhodomonas_salina.1
MRSRCSALARRCLALDASPVAPPSPPRQDRHASLSGPRRAASVPQRVYFRTTQSTERHQLRQMCYLRTTDSHSKYQPRQYWTVQCRTVQTARGQYRTGHSTRVGP